MRKFLASFLITLLVSNPPVFSIGGGVSRDGNGSNIRIIGGQSGVFRNASLPPNPENDELLALGDLTFFKDYAYDDSTADADYSVGSGSATFTATRGSSNPATYVNELGVIQTTTTSDAPRFTKGYYDETGFHSRPGILMEGASTNYALYSGDVSNAAWTQTGMGGVRKSSYEYSTGTLREAFENDSDWTVAGAGSTVADDATNQRSGAQGVKITTGAGVTTTITKTVSIDFSAMDNFVFWAYTADLTDITSMTIRFSSVDTTFASAASITYTSVNSDFKNNGWSSFMFNKADLTLVGGESVSNTMVAMQIEIDPDASDVAEVTVDDLRSGYDARPILMMFFDDGGNSHYHNVRPILNGNDQKGILAVVTTQIAQSGKMSLAQMTTMYNEGWDIINHSYSHITLTGRDDATLNTQFNTSQAYLDSLGYTRASRFFAYPGSASDAASIAKSKEQHYMGRTGFFNGQIFGWPHESIPDDDREMIMNSYGADGKTEAELEAIVDSMIAHKSRSAWYWHDIDVGAETTLVQAVSDHIETKVNADEMDVVTYSEYYDSFVPATATAPDGSTVSLISASADNATVLQAITKTSAAHIFSIFLKAGHVTGNIEITIDGGTTWTAVTLPASSWGRFNVKKTAANPSFGIRIVNQGDSVFMWGGQLEALAFPSTYIPTTTVALTRNLEKLSYPLASNRTAVETILIKFSPLWNGADFTTSYRLTSTKTKERIIFTNASTDKILFRPNGTDSAGSSVSSTTTPVRFTSYVLAGVAHGAIANPNQSIYLDGSSEATENTDYTAPAWGDTFYIGCREIDGLEGFVLIESVAFYGEALSAGDIASVTTILAD